MRLANLDGQAVVVIADHHDGHVDVTSVTPDDHRALPIEDTFDRWQEIADWSVDADRSRSSTIDRSRLGPPSPRPTQVFAIGLNYALHAAESGLPTPRHPTTFTKFASCLTGPDAVVELSSDTVDYEIELVVVIGRRAHRVVRSDAWDHVAGLMIGQDLSDREVQMRPPAPQFSLGKSYPGYGPVGPWITTTDELQNPEELELVTRLNGDVVQHARTSDMIFDVAAIIEYVSHIVPMSPGDLVFTGTPAGVGMGRTPPRYLRRGDVLVSEIEGLGSTVVSFE